MLMGARYALAWQVVSRGEPLFALLCSVNNPAG